MALPGNLLWAAGSLLDALLLIYMWIFIIAAMLTWVQPNPDNPLVRFLDRATEPVLRRLRQLPLVDCSIRPGYQPRWLLRLKQRWPVLWSSRIDFSPLVAILIIYFVRFAVRRALLPTLPVFDAGLLR